MMTEGVKNNQSFKVKVRERLGGSDKADLHDFGQDGFVEMILQSRCAEVSLVHVFLFIL